MLFFTNINSLFKRTLLKRKYHEFLSNKYSSPSDIFLTKSKNYNQSIQTGRRITFKSSLEFGANTNGIINLLGKPLLKYTNKKIANHQILLYKYTLFSSKMICEVHIHDNQFFMGVYTLEAPTTDYYFIKEYLLKRYTADKIPFDMTSIHIVDDEFNSIYLREENKLEIVYLSHKTQHLIA